MFNTTVKCLMWDTSKRVLHRVSDYYDRTFQLKKTNFLVKVYTIQIQASNNQHLDAVEHYTPGENTWRDIIWERLQNVMDNLERQACLSSILARSYTFGKPGPDLDLTSYTFNISYVI